MTTIDSGIRQRAFDQVDPFEDLLPTLASGFDVGTVFQRLSTAASPILPHDKAALAVLSDSEGDGQLYVVTNGNATEVRKLEPATAIADASSPRLLDEAVGLEKGFRSGLSVPVRINDRMVGVLALFSRRPQAYSDLDLLQADRLARYLAVALGHQRMAQQARAAAIEREHAANVETSMELLRAIADVLDVRTVFPRVSEIANKMLPHDAMILSFVDPDGNTVREAVSIDDFPKAPAWRKLNMAPRGELVIGDLRSEELPTTQSQDHRRALLRAGYRSMLGVFAQARDQTIIVGFNAKRPCAFDQRDVAVARRIVDHIALAVSHEQLAHAAEQVAEARARTEQLEARVQRLSEELESKSHLRIVGGSDQWRDALKKATQVASTDTTVLLTGESGTGKEVIARFVHRASPRSKGPFVALNCAALPEQLLESELFGYERGAFTSAHQAKPGQIELAAGGTLFLDEVSEMSLSAQAKFLRVLQEHEFQRLGGTRSVKANVRVVAATNRNLRTAVERGTFREDLFYRLQVFDIQIAPLRERREDILPLSQAFLQDIGKSFGRPPAGLTRDARQALLRYDWPGNVRELRNALERAAILCEGGLIDSAHLTLQGATRTPEQPTADLSTIERETIAQVLRETKWNKVRAAKRLGLSRTQLYNRMKKYGLE
jgi:transcriptional regulator with PAS, ATPase and Fis domain